MVLQEVRDDRFLADMPDPRREQGKRHQLSDMIVIAVRAVICAADSWADVADFGQAKRPWFETFLDLPHGIACQDTFVRVFARLDPDAFEACFEAWTKALAGSSGGIGTTITSCICSPDENAVALGGKSLYGLAGLPAARFSLSYAMAWTSIRVSGRCQ